MVSPIAAAPRQGRTTASDGPISPDLAALGLRLARLRGQAGWTLADLAAASGVSRATLSALEHGRQDVTVTRLLAVDRALWSRLRQVGVESERLLVW